MQVFFTLECGDAKLKINSESKCNQPNKHNDAKKKDLKNCTDKQISLTFIRINAF